MRILITGGRIIDPASGLDKIGDLMISGGRIVEIRGSIFSDNDTFLIDADGLVVAPGLVDMHCHLREPGQTEKEDIESGSLSAAAGGFTSVCCMPNTDPVADNADIVRDIIKRAGEVGVCAVHPIAAVSIGSNGERLTDFGALKEAGAVALSDDGRPIIHGRLMRDAMIEAKRHYLPVISHCEDPEFANGGVMTHSGLAKRLGVPAAYPEAEDTMVAREIAIAANTGAPVHIAHVSTEISVSFIREAKRNGINITAETCPHYFTFTYGEIARKGANAKMNPPLRSIRDVKAIVEGLRDGTIDVIATDHAPHTREEKAKTLVDAPNGVVGFETALAAAITKLYGEGGMSLMEVLSAMTKRPAEIIRLPKGELKVGSPADIVIFDPNKKWMVEPSEFYSKGRSTPFAGMELTGRVMHTIFGGNIVYMDGEIQDPGKFKTFSSR